MCRAAWQAGMDWLGSAVPRNVCAKNCQASLPRQAVSKRLDMVGLMGISMALRVLHQVIWPPGRRCAPLLTRRKAAYRCISRTKLDRISLYLGTAIPKGPYPLDSLKTYVQRFFVDTKFPNLVGNYRKSSNFSARRFHPKPYPYAQRPQIKPPKIAVERSVWALLLYPEAHSRPKPPVHQEASTFPLLWPLLYLARCVQLEHYVKKCVHTAIVLDVTKNARLRACRHWSVPQPTTCWLYNHGLWQRVHDIYLAHG